MGLNFNIPLPDNANSFSKGFGLTDNLMQQILGRNQLKQKAAHEKEALAQAEKHFQLNYGLSKAAAGRAAQAAIDNHKLAQMKLDPDREINQIKKLYELAMSQQNGSQPGNTPTPSEQPQNEQLKQKLEAMGMFGQNNDNQQGMAQGQGVMPLPEQQQQQAPEYPVPESQTPTSPTNNGNPNLMQMIVGGVLKKKTGVNPFAQNKENAYTGPAREALDLSRLKKQFGENSEEYQTAHALEKAKTQQHEDLSAIRSRQLNGLKTGDTEIKDPQTGQTIGFRKQTNDKQKDAAKNTVLFNHLYPLVQLSAELSGPGATVKFEHAARTYKTNPESRRIIDNLLIADKAASTTAVTESSRFNAGHTNQTFNRLVDTIKSEDIHKKLKKWIKDYEIPAEANIKADKRWQAELNKAEKLANSRIPATMDYYFDPDKQFAHQQEEQNKSNEKSEKIKVWDNHDKKWVEITQEEFDKDQGA